MNWLTTFLQTSALCEMRPEKSYNMLQAAR